ncbi:MAG: alpha/beta hydrolase [Crocinitomicaceae bacterium]
MKNILYVTILFSIWSCKKVVLDQLAFPSEKLESYQFEGYDAGNQSVPDEYAVNPNMRTLITMQSKDASSGESYTIYGVYIGDTATISSDTVILYCHGQSLHMDIYYPRASMLANANGKYNYGVFMMDYRGYGMSEGVSDEVGLSEDVDASINWLKSKGATGDRTIYYGFSLGCIPVIERAAFKTDFTPAKIVLEAPLASVANLAHSSTIINVDPAFISTLKFDNAENIKSVSEPLLWFHGEEDDYIALPNGELIFNNHTGEYKEGIKVANAGHSNIPAIFGFEKYVSKMGSFIRE